MVIAALFSYFLLFAQSVEIVIIGLPARGAVSLDLAPAGKVELERMPTVSRVKIEIDRPVTAQAVAHGMNTLVVWAVSPESEYENLGALGVTAGKARLEATTHFDQFAIVITAEPHHLVDRPSAAVAYRNLSPRSDSVRRIVTPVRFGYSDYGQLQESTGDPAAEARAAFQIASAAQADHWAQGELRLARVALDTMEEMMRRGAPIDTVTPAANESIRRSQQALAMARQNAAASALETSKTEASGLKRDLQQLQDRVQRLTTDQAAADERIRKLEFDLERVSREREQLAVVNDGAVTRVRRLETELTQAKQQQEQLENSTVLRLSDDIFDYVSGSVSSGGVTVLTKIVAAAGLWKNPIRLVCPEKGVEIVKRYFVDAGVPDGRIVVQSQ